MTSKNTNVESKNWKDEFVDIPVTIKDVTGSISHGIIREIDGDFAHAITFSLLADTTKCGKDFRITKYVTHDIAESVIKFVSISKIETAHIKNLYIEAAKNGEAYLKGTADGKYSVLARKVTKKTIEVEDDEFVEV